MWCYHKLYGTMGKINNTLKAGENFPAQFGVYWFNGKQLQKGITYY